MAPYANLELVAPKLQNADLAQYFKDVRFGVPADQIERVESPRPGTVNKPGKRWPRHPTPRASPTPAPATPARRQLTVAGVSGTTLAWAAV